ncbi:MmgE/PrpD family protein [Rhodoferax sediminis]|uniref:MmgE/PrpD family protein n=1 Tax=Rhodoferax sediminis TaxID=2509614 RepID=A0A515DE12_9BURK|nr:MmgE/PrpD family protein [Rhodoferax sediminis]QDL38610.1 MmgE/PrpD family protein [Rhodoferax sediminis]
MDATLLHLAHYAVDTDFDQLPPGAAHECERRLVDSVACAAGAFREPLCETLRAFTRHYAGVPPARVWGTGAATSMEMAAFANGTMVRFLDYSDTWLGRGAGHPSDMIPALVAVAEAHRASGRALVAAIVVAYELYCGLCEAAGAERRLDQATFAAVGAAAGTGRLLSLDEARMANALALALAPNLHLYNVRTGTLSDWKGCAGPNGARNGVFAALLACEGVTGPTAPIEGKGGLFDLVGEFELRPGAGTRPLLMDTHLKLHPVCYHGQSAIDAALALRSAVPLEQVVDIHVETYEAAYRAMGSDSSKWAPATRETADHSLPYTVAMALREGRLSSAAYGKDRLNDALTKHLMDKVRVTASDELTRGYPGKVQTRVTLSSADGSVHSHLQEWPKGHAAQPLCDNELEQKFTSLHEAWGDAVATRRTLEAIWSVDQLADVTRLVDALCLNR